MSLRRSLRRWCWPSAAAAQQVTGLTATQDVGFTTLKWAPVAGATDYQIERQSLDANDQPTGTATIVGLWQPTRTITPAQPAFAESGYMLGDRYQWRVRARLGTANPQPYSEPREGHDAGDSGPGEPADGVGAARQGAATGSATYTTRRRGDGLHRPRSTRRPTACASIGDRQDAASGLPLNLLIIGYPKPPDTAAAISAMPTYWVNCNVHGNEASGRESCYTMARQLATTEDPAILAMLSKMTVLILPSSNPEGRREQHARQLAPARTSTATTR